MFHYLFIRQFPAPLFKYHSRRHDRTNHILFPSRTSPCTCLISIICLFSSLLFLTLVRDRCCSSLLIYDSDLGSLCISAFPIGLLFPSFLCLSSRHSPYKHKQ